MTEHFRVLIVGGGVVGCNILRHLTLEGWTDVALCERKELTAGATWHSSGHISCYTGSSLLTDFALYMRSQLKPLVEETGQEIGLRETGSLRLAANDEIYSRFEKFPNTPVGESSGANMVTMTMGGLADNIAYSPEALVIDESLISGVLRCLKGIEVNEKTLGLESIMRSISGSGHFLDDEMTLGNMKSEFVYPEFADRLSIDPWVEEGRPDLRDKARLKVQSILSSHYPDHIGSENDARIRPALNIQLPKEVMHP